MSLYRPIAVACRPTISVRLEGKNQAGCENFNYSRFDIKLSKVSSIRAIEK